MNALTDPQITKFLTQLCFNLVSSIILILVIYMRNNKSKEYSFTFFTFNNLIFITCYILSSSNLGVGFAFGLFAVFSVLRYRTHPMPPKEMTYLFIVISLGLVNSIGSSQVPFVQLIIVNVLILLLVQILEIWFAKDTVGKHQIIYEKINNIKPERKQELVQDLEERLGISVSDIKILKIDLIKDATHLEVSYRNKQ